MATPIPTACTPRAEDPTLSPFTSRGFAAITTALRDAVIRDEALDDVSAGPGTDGVERARAGDAAVSAWCRVEAVACRFLRGHPVEPRALVETAERVLALITLDGLEERGELFEMVGDTMLVRTRVVPGSEEDGLLGAAIPWLYRAARRHADLLPDDPVEEMPDALWDDVSDADARGPGDTPVA